jgi:hypothetical protein
MILLCREGILESNWDKNLKTFDPCYSQSPSLTDFTRRYGLIGLKISTATSKRGEGGLALFTTSLCLSLIILYLYNNTFSPIKNNN